MHKFVYVGLAQAQAQAQPHFLLPFSLEYQPLKPQKNPCCCVIEAKDTEWGRTITRGSGS